MEEMCETKKVAVFIIPQNLRLFDSHSPNDITWAIDSLKYIAIRSEKYRLCENPLNNIFLTLDTVINI